MSGPIDADAARAGMSEPTAPPSVHLGFSLPYGSPDPLPAPLGNPRIQWVPESYAGLARTYKNLLKVTTAGPVVPCPSCFRGWAYLATGCKGCFVDARRRCTAGCAPASIARAHHERVLGQRPPLMRRGAGTKREAFLNARSILVGLPARSANSASPFWNLYGAADLVGELCATADLDEAPLQRLAVAVGCRMGVDAADARDIPLAFADGWNRRWGLDG